jgi:hypothetical protein
MELEPLPAIVKRDKFQVRVEDMIAFIFPEDLQHPLAAGRLFALGMYGPLDEDNMLRTGPLGKHKTTVWELDSMCIQIEREDILSIYLHKQSEMSLLTTEEQESLIAQADSHLKREKGRAMLPQITRDDIIHLFKVSPISPYCVPYALNRICLVTAQIVYLSTKSNVQLQITEYQE